MAAAVSADAGRLAGPVWRLQSLRPRANLSFLLTKVETTVGYAAPADLVLPVAGVSRQHALLLRTAAGALEVRDLGSRNGTFVNGIRVEQYQVAAGDELAFGPVSLRVDRVDAGDAALALTLESGDLERAATETEWQLAPGPVESGVELVRLLLVLMLGDGSPDLARALQVLCENQGATSGAVGEWEGTAEPRLLATFGDAGVLAEHFAVSTLLDEVRQQGHLAPSFRTAWLAGQPPLLCCGFQRPEASLLSLLLRGDGLSGSASELGEIFLRLIDQARSPTGSRERRQIAGDFGRLALPASFVRGVSPRMQRVYQQLEQVRDGDFPILVLGETGVGKEHLVRLIHDSSGRRQGPFVAINCAAIPPELLEAEMFGIGRGVASGVAERSGRMRQASGGTLLLDEVGEMPLPLQAKLLRALESGVVLPVGAAPVSVDARIVAATNADLRSRIASGSFRADLYYRLAGFELEVPPLRERAEDVPLLLQHFLGRLCAQADKRITGVTVSALELLTAYRWPGNVRELENEVRRLVFVCPSGQAIDSSMVHSEIRRAAGSELAPPQPNADLNLEARVAAVEAAAIREALARSGGSRSGAARLLGLSRNGLAAKMTRHGIGGGSTGD
ncbi:MAG TPA: sigma 54-interacting transcriptional regulator [Thermoanaerobaculia bacterium]|nr:sigma 54-interacting transcriptional regulator [Thermoanaerobaculia bacterium]